MINLEQYNLIYFSTTTCMPCKATKPVVEKISSDLTLNTLFYTIDIEDDGREVAKEYDVRSVPTILFIKDGEEVGRKIGITNEKEFEELYKSYTK